MNPVEMWGGGLMLSDGLLVLSSGLCTSGSQEAPHTSNWPSSGTAVSRSGEFDGIWLQQREMGPGRAKPSCAQFPQ